MDQSTKTYIDGDPDQVKEGILAASERYATGDIGIVTNCYDFEQRKTSYSLVSKSLGLSVKHNSETNNL